MAAASFNEEFEKMLMTSEAGRPATLNNTSLRTLIENRSLNDYKKDGATKAKSAINYFTKAGLIDKTLAEIAENTVAFKNAMVKATEETSSSQGNNNQKYLSGIMEAAGHPSSWPRNTLLAELGDKPAKEMFDLTVDRATVHGMPKDVYQKLKESVVALNAKGDKEAATQLIMHMLGGYRPEDINGINLENIDFETGVIRNVEIKDAGTTTLKTLILPDPILDAVKDYVGDRRTGILFSNTQANATRINNMFDKIFPKDYLTVTSRKLGTRQEPMRVKKLRNLNESILKALRIDTEARNVLTGRAAKTVGDAYAAVDADIDFIKDIGANSTAIFSGGTASSSASQFMADMGVKTLSTATKGIRVTKNLLQRAGLLRFLEDGQGDFLESLPTKGGITGNDPIESDPRVTEAQNKFAVARLNKLEGEEIIAAAERAEEVEAGREKLAKTRQEKKQEAKAESLENTKSKLLANITKVGRPIVSALPPVVFTAGVMSGMQRSQGSPMPVRIATGLAEGAAELLAPVGMAPSDAPFREEQRATMPTGAGLSPRTDVAPQMDAMGYIKPEFAPYPMEAAPQPNIPDPVAPKPQMAAQGFIPVPEARANAIQGEETTMKESEVPSFLYGGIVR